MKRDCVDERSEEFSGVERRVLKRGDISFDEERNQMSIQVLCRRGGMEKILGAECQEDYLSGAPPSVGAERTRKFLVLQTLQMAGNGTSRRFLAEFVLD